MIDYWGCVGNTHSDGHWNLKLSGGRKDRSRGTRPLLCNSVPYPSSKNLGKYLPSTTRRHYIQETDLWWNLCCSSCIYFCLLSLGLIMQLYFAHHQQNCQIKSKYKYMCIFEKNTFINLKGKLSRCILPIHACEPKTWVYNDIYHRHTYARSSRFKGCSMLDK